MGISGKSAFSRVVGEKRAYERRAPQSKTALEKVAGDVVPETGFKTRGEQKPPPLSDASMDTLKKWVIGED